MKTRLVVAICLLAVCLATALFCVWQLEARAKALQEGLEFALETALLDEPSAEITEEVLRIWRKSRPFLHILLPHMSLNELEWALGSLPEFQRQGERMLYIEHCVRAIQCVKTVREMERLNWSNVF